MSSYNRLERNLARFLARFPAMKRFAKVAYSRLVYLTSKKPYKHRSRIEPAAFLDQHQSSFFGYYDKSPQNRSGVVLALVVDGSTKKKPSIDSSVELVAFGAKHEPLFRVPVKSYNWQQGCRSHWLSDDLFIFNDFDPVTKNYVARVYSMKIAGEVRHFSYPVQDSYHTEYFLSLNYRRLLSLRPDYGYRNLPQLDSFNLKNLENDGIWKVDYQTGNARLLISLAQACLLNPLPEFDDAVHKFNHVMISPSGRQFIFLHRYVLGQRRFDRLVLADAETGALRLLSDHGMVSHCFWVDDSTVLGYLRGPGDVDGYWLVDTISGSFTPCLQDKLAQFGDGHPHVHGDWFVTDTYPDKARMQHLLLCNWKTGEVKEIGEFFHGFEFSGESRCDLHPRFAPDGESVYFDSVFSGERRLYRMGLFE